MHDHIMVYALPLITQRRHIVCLNANSIYKNTVFLIVIYIKNTSPGVFYITTCLLFFCCQRWQLFMLLPSATSHESRRCCYYHRDLNHQKNSTTDLYSNRIYYHRIISKQPSNRNEQTVTRVNKYTNYNKANNSKNIMKCFLT